VPDATQLKSQELKYEKWQENSEFVVAEVEHSTISEPL
jgi:hypothetical protein